MTSGNESIRNGSAKAGVHHWWAQRLSALALIPLSIWFVSSLVMMPFASYDTVLEWMSGTFNATALLIMTMSILYHAALGMQVVYEDYIHCECVKLGFILVTKFVFLFLAVIAFLSITKVYFLVG
jgi:succinate dehydrogenase / fumarate reductase membrane anchor subunit